MSSKWNQNGTEISLNNERREQLELMTRYTNIDNLEELHAEIKQTP